MNKKLLCISLTTLILCSSVGDGFAGAERHQRPLARTAAFCKRVVSRVVLPGLLSIAVGCATQSPYLVHRAPVIDRTTSLSAPSLHQPAPGLSSGSLESVPPLYGKSLKPPQLDEQSRVRLEPPRLYDEQPTARLEPPRLLEQPTVRVEPLRRPRLPSLATSDIAVAQSAGSASNWTQPPNPKDACSVFQTRPNWLRAATSAQREFRNKQTNSVLPVDGMLALAFVESSLRPAASAADQTGTVKSVGLGQFLPPAWSEFEAAIGSSANRENPEHSIRAIFWHASKISYRIGVDVRLDVEAFAHAHNVGAGAYLRGERNDRHAGRVVEMQQKYAAQLGGCQAELNRIVFGWR